MDLISDLVKLNFGGSMVEHKKGERHDKSITFQLALNPLDIQAFHFFLENDWIFGYTRFGKRSPEFYLYMYICH